MIRNEKQLYLIISMIDSITKISFVVFMLLSLLNTLGYQIQWIERYDATPIKVLLAFLMTQLVFGGPAHILYLSKAVSANYWQKKTKSFIPFCLMATAIAYISIPFAGIFVFWATGGYANFVKKKWKKIFPDE